MLKDEIEQMKRKDTELEYRQGGCKFCGQIASWEAPEEWGKQFLDELATENCDCLEAKEYTWKKGKKERAVKAIEKQFGQQAGENEVQEDIVDLLADIAEQIVENRLSSATLDIGNGIKAKIAITSKGFVKVERTKTEKATQEA